MVHSVELLPAGENGLAKKTVQIQNMQAYDFAFI